jgi:HK97 family phage prohead protease
MTIKPNDGIEYRYVERDGAPTLKGGKLSGRAAPFNTETMIGKKPWGFREKIAPGAFKDSIENGDVVLLDNHQNEKPIARQSAGTLKLSETKGGLDWDAAPANTSYANDAIENARAGNFGGCSFGFEVVRDSWHYNKDDDVDERTLHQVKLHEISVCTFPAYADGTSVSARDQAAAAMEARDEYYMREYLDLYVVDGVDEDDERGGNAKGDGSKPYGNVTYADPGYQKDGKKRYPIDTAAHAKAAWAYINKAANAGAYSAKQLASIKSKIKAACAKFGVKISKPKAGKNSADLDIEPRAEDETLTETTMNNDLRNRLVEILADGGLGGDARCLKALSELALNAATRVEEDSEAFERAVRKAVKKALRAAEAVAPVANNGVGTGADNDGDDDDPVCEACGGSGLADDGVAKCEGGCAGTGKVAGPGDNKGGNGTDAGDDPGDHEGSEDGLGVNDGAHDDANVPATGENSKNTSGEETRTDSEPDSARDTSAADAARRMKAAARRARLAQEAREAELVAAE